MDSVILIILILMFLPVVFIFAAWLFPFLLLAVITVFSLSCKGFIAKIVLILLGCGLCAYIDDKIHKEDESER